MESKPIRPYKAGCPSQAQWSLTADLFGALSNVPSTTHASCLSRLLLPKYDCLLSQSSLCCHEMLLLYQDYHPRVQTGVCLHQVSSYGQSYDLQNRLIPSLWVCSGAWVCCARLQALSCLTVFYTFGNQDTVHSSSVYVKGDQVFKRQDGEYHILL